MVREYVEIGDCGSIEGLIERLVAVRRSIPSGATPERVELRGDDNFGRHILVTYLRPESAEEAELERRASAGLAAWAAAGGRPEPVRAMR
ncbi:MAG TPA: hypothetical protein VF727_03325 [Allosphingosinicella sp.]|jgi:hypothetical protein